MARPRTDHVEQVRQKLVTRLTSGHHRPGERFLSNRAIGRQFGVSYQTADRLVRELVERGLLVRRSASGTYLPGRSSLRAVRLVFHARARRKESFGARLLREICARLDRDGVEWKISWADGQRSNGKPLGEDEFPVLWECPRSLDACVRAGRRALLLNDRPASGMASVIVDSVSVDDFTGGACAAQMLIQRSRGKGSRFAIVSGPGNDRRSDERTAGFLSSAKAAIISASGWYLEDGLQVASRAVDAGPSGIFCCNDRLAEAILQWCAEQEIPPPPLVGFDDAPVAEQLNLSTIAIPWNELISGAMGVIHRRLSGDATTACRQVFAPRPLMRGS